MKKIYAILIMSIGLTFALGFASWSNNTNRTHKKDNTCAVCTFGVEGLSDIEVCKGDNGNALLSDLDTGMEYRAYLDNLVGVTCERIKL